MAKVVTLVDRDAREGTVRRSAYALLTLARRLGEPVAVLGGPAPTEEEIRTLGRYGATEIWCLEQDGGAAAPAADPIADHDARADRAPMPGPRTSIPGGGDRFASAGSAVAPGAEPADPPGLASAEAPAASSVTDTDFLAALADRLEPAAILIAASHQGQETAARLAIRLDSGIITDAIDILPGPDGEPVAIQRCLAGSYLVESTVVRGVPIITVRPEAAAPQPRPARPAVRTLAVEPTESRVPRIAATVKPPAAHPALDHADIVVAGGRGVGSRAAFAVLAEVADALGGAVAGSHTAAELGWVAPEARVGLTGKTVHPHLYLACGVSGSVRHRAGMQGAKTVVAIGDDPGAPIFQVADLGVVGDVRAVLPALLTEIRARKKDSGANPDPD